jgi:hypothetical protein
VKNPFSSLFRRARRYGAGNIPLYAVGRFRIVRETVRQMYPLLPQATWPGHGKTLFPGVEPARVVRELDRESVCLGLDLPAATVQSILRFARQERCVTEVDGVLREYAVADRFDEEAGLGRPLIRAGYRGLRGRCPAIVEIERDETLLRIAALYLNRTPRLIRTHLWWSFACEATTAERLAAQQTVLYHYDLESCRFVYFNFYLTRVDETTGGEHVLVRGSHLRKKLSFLWGPANRSDEEIHAAYGADKALPIYGGPGTGFAEDAFCYHKAMPPTGADRLMLQIRIC